MELILNLAWGVLAILLVRLWLLHAPRTKGSPGAQIVALALLILLLFPVISASDDLIAAQNPAEIETSLRRDCGPDQLHCIVPTVGIVPYLQVLDTDSFASSTEMALDLMAPLPLSPALLNIRNRPPPVA
jgi:hypothetical protein